jgi:ADP-dependent phosphofructokinase/glucokinase
MNDTTKESVIERVRRIIVTWKPNNLRMQLVIESVQMNNTTKEIVTERVRLHVVTWKIDI